MNKQPYELTGGQIHINRPTEKIRCECGSLIAIQADDGGYLFPNPPAIFVSNEETVVICRKCKTPKKSKKAVDFVFNK